MSYDYRFDYGEIYTLMRKFKNLTKTEVRIMDYLVKRNVAEVTYSQLTTELGLPKTFVSNVHKAMKHLEMIGCVCIVRRHDEDDDRNHSNNPMTACFVADGWLNGFLVADVD